MAGSTDSNRHQYKRMKMKDQATERSSIPSTPAPPAAPEPEPAPERSADDIITNASAAKRYQYYNEDTGRLWIKRLSCPEAVTWHDSLERDADGNIDDPYADAKLIALCIVDSKGKRKFTDDQVTRIAGLAHNVIRPLVAAIMDYNAMSARGVEAIRKNSDATPGNDFA